MSGSTNKPGRRTGELDEATLRGIIESCQRLLGEEPPEPAKPDAEMTLRQRYLHQKGDVLSLVRQPLPSLL